MNGQNFEPGRSKIIHIDTTITTNIYIAEAFISYFTSVAVMISSEVSNTDIDFRDFLQDYNLIDTFFLPPLTPCEIKEITLELKLSGGGHLEVLASRFKIIIDLIPVPLSNDFNMCIEMSYFLDLFKIARVVPINKSNYPILLNNYRNFSLLSAFSKIFEKRLCKRINSYLTIKKILC